MFCPGAEGISVRMRSVIIWRLSATVSPHGFGTERDADCLHEGPSPTRLQPSATRGLSVGNSSPGVWRFAHGVSPHEMQPAADWVRLFESLPRCMALPGNAMKIRRADWEAAAPRYQRHGGGGGEKWIPLERSASGSVYEDPRRAGRLCRTAKSTRGCVEDGFQPAAEYHQQIRKGPPVHHCCHNCVCKCVDLGS